MSTWNIANAPEAEPHAHAVASVDTGIGAIAACKCGAGFLAENDAALREQVSKHLMDNERGNLHVVYAGPAGSYAQIPAVPGIEWTHK